MNKLLPLLIVFGTIFFIGCIGDNTSSTPQQVTQYVCPDGTTVSNAQDCPKQSVCGNGICETGETCSSCPTDCGVCVKSESEALQKIIDTTTLSWNRYCTNSNHDLQNSLFFVAKVDFKNNFISCNKYNQFYNVTNSILTRTVDASCQSGVCVYEPTVYDLNKTYVQKMVNCDASLINDYKRLITGYGSPSPDYNLVNIKEYCNDCEEIYFVHTYCGEPGLSFASTFWSGYVDINTGKVYE